MIEPWMITEDAPFSGEAETEGPPHPSRKWLFRLMLFIGWIGAFYLVACLKIIVPAVVERLWH